MIWVYIHSVTSIVGHLVVTMNPTDYATKIVIPFPLTVNPGTSTTTNQQATTVNITHACHIFAPNIYDTFHICKKSLKTQLFKAVDYIYIEELHNEDSRYSGITTLNIIAHIWLTYGDRWWFMQYIYKLIQVINIANNPLLATKLASLIVTIRAFPNSTPEDNMNPYT